MVQEILLICAVITLVAVCTATYVTVVSFCVFQRVVRQVEKEVEAIPAKVDKAVADFAQPYKETPDVTSQTFSSVGPVKSPEVDEDRLPVFQGYPGESW